MYALLLLAAVLLLALPATAQPNAQPNVQLKSVSRQSQYGSLSVNVSADELRIAVGVWVRERQNVDSVIFTEAAPAAVRFFTRKHSSHRPSSVLSVAHIQAQRRSRVVKSIYSDASIDTSSFFAIVQNPVLRQSRITAGLNFQSCASDSDCRGNRVCSQIGSDRRSVQKCAGGKCFCLAASVACKSDGDCSTGETCRRTGATSVCVANVAQISTRVNGESCILDSNCKAPRTCMQRDSQQRVQSCFRGACSCFVSDPSCTTDADCDDREGCVSASGVQFCLSRALFPSVGSRRLALSGQACQQDGDCIGGRQCLQFSTELRSTITCNSGLCKCTPQFMCGGRFRRSCFRGEQCTRSGSSQLCVQDGSVAPPPTPTGFNFEACTMDGDCQGTRSCIMFEGSGVDTRIVACTGANCICLSDVPFCENTGAQECSFGETCLPPTGAVQAEPVCIASALL